MNNKYTEKEMQQADEALSFIFNKKASPWVNLIAMVKKAREASKC